MINQIIIVKKFTLILIIYVLVGILFSQENPALKVTQFTLENGLTVYLNEDHSLPQIFGAVVVNAGGKNDPKDATGIAHYLEHVMFKGTDKIGTLNWEAEKPILDSISLMYDYLFQTQDDAKRKEIQKTINQLSLRAAEYAIPNETDLILQHIGGTRINAGTSNDYTVYHNLFPSNQIEKWFDIYVERFRNPVFRLFQSELETVYEEKNMYEDNFFMKVLEEYIKHFWKVHPYGQQSIIGTTEHLKNPRLSKMVDFYNTYYVANNMALMLSGDFITDDVIPLIKEKFAIWENRPVPENPVYVEKPFNGREEVNVKMTPLPMGAIGFRTVPANHEDEIALTICGEILSNQNQTGLLDELMSENQIWGVYAMNFTMNDLGGFHILFIPKLLVQKLSDAEALIINKIKKLRSGDFSEQFFEGVKLNYLKEHLQNLENLETRGPMLLDCFTQKKSWEDVLAVADKVNKLTKDDIVRIANQYLGDNYLVANSRMGSPKKDKIEKPDWKPIVSQQNGKKSEFALWLESLPETEMPPRFVDFNKDLVINTLCKGVDYYQTTNTMNPVFSLTFRFKVGTETNNRYSYVADYLNEVGTSTQSAKEFKSALQNLGATLNFSCSKNNFEISIDGFDGKMEETLQLVAQILQQPEVKSETIKRLWDNEKGNYKMSVNDPATLGKALFEYVQYGQKSSFINKLSLKEIKKLTPEELIALFKEVITYESEVHYTGTLPMAEIQSLLLKHINFSHEPKKASFIEIPVAEISQPAVYLHSNKKSLQSNIYIYNNGNVANEKEKALLNAFNEYFGNGMSGLVFQEIRELRSLGYSTRAAYINPKLRKNKGFLKGYLGTQSDKTIDGVEALVGLVKNMPQKPERIETIKRSLIQGINMENVSFRDLTWQVSRWRFQGYVEDPRKFQHKIYENLTFEDIVAVYQKFIKGNPIAVTISGNSKKFNTKSLSAFGKINYVKTNEIIKH